MLYIGKLSGLTASDRSTLVVRMEQLLVGQYHVPSSDAKIESLAIEYVGKLRSLNRGGHSTDDSVKVEGGLVSPSLEVQINLWSFQTLEVEDYLYKK